MAASMTMCLKALGYTDLDEDQVNRVMGAQPMKGAAWEQALACAQHYGCRATLTMPATVEQLKAWTDAGVPVMIAWNPEGRPWSHASVVFDVDADLNVYVADPNIPNPKETVRVVTEDDFYHKWYEKFPDYLVRRPACAIEREVTLDGKQVNILAGTGPNPVKLLASKQASIRTSEDKAAADKAGKGIAPKVPLNKTRNEVVRDLIDRGQAGQGSHKNKQDYERGHARRPKHPGREMEAAEMRLVERFMEAAYSGNPDGKPIYNVEIDHGEHQPLSGGWDIMKRLQDQYRIEQGHPPRESNPRLATITVKVPRAPAGKLVVDISTRPNLDFPAGSEQAEVPFSTLYLVVPDLATAKVNFRNHTQGIGSGNNAGGKVYDDKGKVVAYVSYNGRLWQVDHSGQPTTELKLGRWNANSSGEVERLARRFVAAQIGGNK